MLEGKVTGFQDILGNDMVKEHFKKAIENHKISHICSNIKASNFRLSY